MTVKDHVNAIETREKRNDEIISILEEIQRIHGYLPEEALRKAAEKTNRSLVDIYGVATFYKYFSLKPRGEHLIAVCLGTACHVRQGHLIVKEFENQLGIKAGETTADNEFTLETVSCLGACARGPMVVVDAHYFSNVNALQVKQIIKKTRDGLDKADIKKDERIFPVKVRCPYCNHSLLDPNYLIDGYPSVRLTTSFGRKHGWIRMSSLYGSYNYKSEHEIPIDTIIHNFCPHCHNEMVSASFCPLCNAPMVPMVIYGGGLIKICSRRGCKNHMIDLVKGLCINCENRDTCKETKLDGSIWHCEEYQ